MLADGSEHQGPSAVDLLVAAAAELSGLSLLHYDHDFETIARTTQQPTTWLAAPGSIDARASGLYPAPRCGVRRVSAGPSVGRPPPCPIAQRQCLHVTIR